mmetsp:Transcript_26483/g.39398  ORF Transcript_26483/g.39398 Transcript_26483/m.39398 type:complete len:277 (-) Transcript_26483:16-846(-)
MTANGTLIFENPKDPATMLKFEILKQARPIVGQWARMAKDGQLVQGFGEKAATLVEQSLEKFDFESVKRRDAIVDRSTVAPQRESLQRTLESELTAAFFIQRSSLEDSLYKRLKKDLLKKMRWLGRELTVQEKIALLQPVLTSYDKQASGLRPPFVPDAERAQVERRFSELQWGIQDTAEGQELEQQWKVEKLRRASGRKRGLSMSFSPGLRVMLRPPGLGNFEVFSNRQLGHTAGSGEISVGIFNDGSIADVYNKKAHPARWKLQPTLGIDLRSK